MRQQQRARRRHQHRRLLVAAIVALTTAAGVWTLWRRRRRSPRGAVVAAVESAAAVEKKETRRAALEKLATCSEVDVYRDGGQRVNETWCVAPVVQLRRKLRVRLVPKAEKGGKRAFYLLSQGLRQHPWVELVGTAPRFCEDHDYALDNRGSRCEDDPRTVAQKTPDADVAVVCAPATDPKFYSSERGALAYSPYRWEDNKRYAMNPIRNVGEKLKDADANPTLFRYEPPVPRSRVVFVDENDSPAPLPDVRDGDYLAYFKRSWVVKQKGTAPGAHRTRYFPTAYALADEYLDSKRLPPISGPRPIDVLCTLRANVAKRGQRHQGPRDRVATWLEDEFLGGGRRRPGGDPSSQSQSQSSSSTKWRVHVGELSTSSRNSIDAHYLHRMRMAKVVVTCNPNNWEGDFRLFEALSSGALVLVDRMATPYHHPLVHKEHLLYYDSTNRSDLLAKIHFALAHPRWARTVATNGYKHVLRHHRSVSWVDYFLRTAHALILREKHQDDDPAYVETGLDVLQRTAASEHVILHHPDADR